MSELCKGCATYNYCYCIFHFPSTEGCPCKECLIKAKCLVHCKELEDYASDRDKWIKWKGKSAIDIKRYYYHDEE